MIKSIILGVVALIAVSIFFASTFITIDSGQAGVMYKKFSGGTVTNESFQEGFHVIAPWNSMFIYDIRTQQVDLDMEALSKNGLTINLGVSVRYAPIASEIGFLHQQIGMNYLETIIIPEIRSSTRKIIGQYDPEELYSTKRESIQTEIFSETKKIIEKKHLLLDAILIRHVILPATIKTAIENKLKQEQESKEYEFRLEKEKKEADRKRIEAQGIKDFQDIVSKGLNDQLLRWKGIEATLELSKSANAKVVVVGGKDGLPLILGDK